VSMPYGTETGTVTQPVSRRTRQRVHEGEAMRRGGVRHYDWIYKGLCLLGTLALLAALFLEFRSVLGIHGE
jgi:hypothetical protein